MQDLRIQMQYFGRMRTRIDSAKVSQFNARRDEEPLAIQKGYEVLDIMGV